MKELVPFTLLLLFDFIIKPFFDITDLLNRLANLFSAFRRLVHGPTPVEVIIYSRYDFAFIRHLNTCCIQIMHEQLMRRIVLNIGGYENTEKDFYEEQFVFILRSTIERHHA